MKVSKGRAVAAVIAAGVVAASCYALRQIPASFGYGISAEFEHLPPDDQQLKEWWQSQPGIASEVHVARHGNSVGVLWVMTQSIGPRTPPVPDFKAAFERLGYRGLVRINSDWRGDGDWPADGKDATDRGPAGPTSRAGAGPGAGAPSARLPRP